MAPGTRRANRGLYADHDDFEGLPVRQWRQEWVNVAPPMQQEQHHQNDIWAIELFHGMPKDANLLPPHSQELLRAARSGRLYKRPPPAEEDDGEENELLVPEKPEKKDDDGASQRFSVKIWKQVPRNVEAATISYLAKRRKDTLTIASKTVDEKMVGSTVTRATVRRIDAAGNPYTEEVTLVEGEHVEGEIISTRVEAAAAHSRDAAAIAPPPSRRRPPPPKRKAKAGPGRGRKKAKHLMHPHGQPTAHSADLTTEPIKKEDQAENGTTETERIPNQDCEMADADEDDDEEEGDDGEEGDEGDEGDDDGVENDRPPAVLSADSNDREDGPAADSGIVDHVQDSRQEKQAAPEDEAVRPGPDSATYREDAGGSPPKEDSNLVSPNGPHSPGASPLLSALPVEAEIGTGSTADGEAPVEVTEKPIATTDRPPSGREVAEFASAEVPRPATESANEEIMLLPPPDQVGNIDSPKAEDVGGKAWENDDAASHDVDANLSEGEISTPPPARHGFDIASTGSVIKPDDSASVRFPLTGSGSTSELGTGLAEDAMHSSPKGSQLVSSPKKDDVNATDELREGGDGQMEERDHDSAHPGDEKPALLAEVGPPARTHSPSLERGEGEQQETDHKVTSLEMQPQSGAETERETSDVNQPSEPDASAPTAAIHDSHAPEPEIGAAEAVSREEDVPFNA